MAYKKRFTRDYSSKQRRNRERPMKPKKFEIRPSSNRDRAILTALEKEYPGQIVTQGYLRLETALGSQSQINFNILRNESAPLSTERRLSINDAFAAYDMAVLLKKVVDGDAQGGSIVDTFPNSLTYTAAGEAAALNHIYNGYTSIRVDATVFVDSMDNMRFYRVGSAQQGVDLGGGTGLAPDLYLADTWASTNYPFAPLTPGITFSGSSKNEIEITLPDSVDMSGTSSTNYAVMYFRGVLINNGARFKNK